MQYLFLSIYFDNKELFDNMLKDKKIPLGVKAGRVFIMILPALVVISLLIQGA
jgi:hypothetical protein